MATPADFIEQQRRAQLAALARGGQGAVTAYQDATAQLAARQQAAIDAELAASRTRGAGPAAEAAIAEIIGQGAQPYQQLLSARQGADTQRFLARGIVEDVYMGRMRDQIPAIEAQLAREEAERRRGRGGGERGGGEDDTDWWDPLEEDFDTKSDLYDWIGLHAGEGRTPAFMVQRALAAELGIPEKVAEVRFQPGEYLTEGLRRAARAAERGMPVRRFRRRAKQAARADDSITSRAPERRYLVDQYRQMLRQQPRRRRGRRR
jgi:hypothetical protein